MFKTVLFPIDESREAREAARIVSNIVKTYNSRLVILSVVEENPKQETLASEIMASTEQVAKLLEGAKALFAQEGIEAEVIERKGMAPFVICDVAEEINADLIVMGCRGLGLTEEGAHESVTQRTINLSPCPVLVVP
ncbi:MAG: universal stress protein [Cyanobacteria bacterium J083]|nr:MAG: universal stress protein [Cyanobacteria bacterium J083]